MKLLSKATSVFNILILVCYVVFFAKTANSQADWYQWRGPNRDGVSTEKGGLSVWREDEPKVLWETSVGTGYSSMSISNGRLYTLGNSEKQDTVYCLDVNTGDVIWKYSYPCEAKGEGYPGPASTPTIDSNKVYTFSREGDLFCFSVESGEVIWAQNVIDLGAKSPQWGFTSSPLVLDKMVIVDAGRTLALDKSDGSLIWKTNKDYADVWEDIDSYGGGYSSPIAFNINNTQRLAVFNSSGLVLLEPQNGKELSLYPWKTAWNVNATTPIFFDDKLFLSSGYNTGCKLFQINDEDKPILIWENKNMRNHFNSSVLWEGYLYGFDENRLKCLDSETGEEKWAQAGLGKGSLMIADAKIIALSDKGVLVIADASPNGYNEISRAKVLDGLCWTVPVLSNGKIFARSHPGSLICLDVSKSGK